MCTNIHFTTSCYIVESVTRIYNKPGEFGQLQVSCSTTNNYVNRQDIESVNTRWFLIFTELILFGPSDTAHAQF